MSESVITPGSRPCFMLLPSETPRAVRMRFFTKLSKRFSPFENRRRYADDPFESTDIVGLSPSIDFEFVVHPSDALSAYLFALLNGASGSGCLVILYEPEGGECGKTYPCKSAVYTAVAGGSCLDLNGMLRCSGTFRLHSDKEEGTAVISDDGMSLIFTPAA